MKMIERFGLTGPLANASAISSTETEPLPSSSAPLLIESIALGIDLAQRILDRVDPGPLLGVRYDATGALSAPSVCAISL